MVSTKQLRGAASLGYGAVGIGTPLVLRALPDDRDAVLTAAAVVCVALGALWAAADDEPWHASWESALMRVAYYSVPVIITYSLAVTARRSNRPLFVTPGLMCMSALHLLMQVGPVSAVAALFGGSALTYLAWLAAPTVRWKSARKAYNRRPHMRRT